MQILDAAAQHAGGIAEIYNHAVEHTTAIWNAADRAEWIAERQAGGFPVPVALEDDGTVLGYATYGPWRPHDGYRHTVEHSLYVREGLRGRGTGSALLTALLERARAQGIHVMVAGIDADNEGFDRVGVLPQVGVKFGRWLDLVFLQLVLDQAPAAADGSSSSR